ncbi:HEPN domain-containing protein [Leptospira mtsangambouensis]|nr:HEPN domain-containing protein [Leptospira mtsangambouensis]
MKEIAIKNLLKLIEIIKSDEGIFLSINTAEKIKLKNEILKFLSKNEIAGKNSSKKFLDKQLTKYLLEAKREQNPRNPEDFINHMIEYDRQEFIVTEVFLPFSGGKISSPISLFDCDIEEYNENLRKVILQSIHKVVSVNTKYSEDQKKKLIAENEKYLLKTGDFLVLRYKAKRERELVIENAQEKFAALLRVCNLISLFECNPNDGICFLPGVSQINIHHNKIDVSQATANFSIPLFGGKTLYLNDVLLSNIYEPIIRIYSDYLSGKKMNYPDDKIKHSILWASNANISFSFETKILNIIIAIETLIPKQKGNSIVSYISESVAFILGQNAEGKKYYYNLMKHLYDERGKLAHGSGTKLSELDYNNALSIYAELLTYLINNKNLFKNEKELLELVLEKKFGN